MLSPKISQQIFQQNLQIEKQIASQKGYHLENSPFLLPKPPSKQSPQKFLTNPNLNPLKVNDKQLPKSQQYRTLLKQIQQLEIEKCINNMSSSITTKKNEEKGLNVQQLINRKIKEYNYLVEHKHLQRRKPAKSMFDGEIEEVQVQKKEREGKLGELEETKGLIDDIKGRQKELGKTGNFMEKFKRNQDIVGLYRKYSNSINLNAQQKLTKSRIQNSSNSALKRNNPVPIIKNQVLVKKPQQNDRKENKRYEFSMEQPYIDKKFIQNSTQLNDSVKKSRRISQLMKQRILDLRQKNNSTHQQITNKNNNEHQKQEQTQLKTNLSQFSLQFDRISSKLYKSNSSLIDNKKQQCLSQALQKFSPRYIKYQGSKFLTRYKPHKIAKQMIEGPSQSIKNINKSLLPHTKLTKIYIPDNLGPQDHMIMQLMIEEENDAHYWTTCRNEKINLMLKRHHPH